MDEKTSISEWANGEFLKIVPKFPDKFREVNPRHPAWHTRIKSEVDAVMRYLKYLKQKGTQPWFQLAPSDNPKYNSMIWRGYLTNPDRPDIKFDIVVLLGFEYPKTTPLCYTASKILRYCGNIFTQNIWNDPDDVSKKYVMICDDQRVQQEIWTDNLGIVHFLVHKIWLWWSTQQNAIIQEFDRRKAAKPLKCH